ncbi:hypothetical protein R5R35_004074 [Gryllus longicercus]|uniref:PHD-type domain-containing protein n=1 Tax=Gryllus longicercus TaxID=2509291 RepID=A0AAN9Z8X8_9ORTH
MSSQNNEEPICSICNILIHDLKYAICDSCKRPNHYKCAVLSTTEQRCLELKVSRRVKFYCDDCEKGLQVLPQVLSTLSALKLEINSLRDAFSKQLQDVTKQAAPLPENQSNQLEEMIEEYTDRQRRKKNLIFIDINESDSCDVEVRRKTDLDQVFQVLNSITNEQPIINSTHRLGKKLENKTRPLKVIFQNPDIALSILKRKHLYNGTVRIFSDKTPKQRDYLNQLKLELDRLNSIEGSQEKTIKYINGTPKIIDLHPQKTQTKN